MSSALKSKSSIKVVARYLVVFLLLGLVLNVFVFLSWFSIRSELHDYCLDDVEQRLQEYLRQRSTGVLVTRENKAGGDSLGGLSFVRLVRGNEQFFFTDHPQLDIALHDLIQLDHRRNALWVSLEEEAKSGDWVIVSLELENDLLAQGGREYPGIVGLHRGLTKASFFMAVVAMIVAGIVTLYIRNRSLSSLRQAEKALSTICGSTNNVLLYHEGNEELSDLYGLLNDLVGQNRQLVKEMQESLDNVAHDLRTPMTRLRSVAEYGLQEKDPEELSSALSDCLEESERVLSMLGIMMSVAEAESGTLHLQRKPISLSDTIYDVISLYEYVAEEMEIHMHTDVDASLTIFADPTRITQVWANIVDNGIKYGKKGGYVKVYSTIYGDRVSIFFEDDGMGISETEKERIWERLFRGDRSRTRQGLGLGLNYARAVTEAHGGKISVESALGKGACFRVDLPIIAQEEL